MSHVLLIHFKDVIVVPNMFIKAHLLTLLLTGSATGADRALKSMGKKGKKSGDGGSGKKGTKSGGGGDGGKKLYLTITNLAFQQPFSPFFVMVHNADADPLFTFGTAATAELAILAENGNPGPLADVYNDAKGVLSAVAFTDEAPTFVGEKLVIPITVTKDYPYVTIASMAINTNDCFVAINGMKLSDGDRITGPGYDAGTEENNELCNSIPGPACAQIDSGNESSGSGEGVVHVHRGFFGVGDLPQAGYDWRNPMVLVEVSK
jgi:hypothetical protein